MTDRHFRRLAILTSCLLAAIPGFALATPDVAIATSVESLPQARKASLLVDSLRRFGGPLADAPVHVVVDSVLEETASLWNRPGVTAHPLEGDPALRRFPYARKVLAAAQIERLVERTARTLIWLDAETLVLSSPSALVLRGNATLAVRPVFLRNAVALPEGAPLDGWWTRIAREAGLDPSFPDTVAPLVDAGRVRWYVNCGVYAVKPSKGLLREWARAVSTLAADPAIRAEAGPGGLRHVFLHQAVFSAVVLARTKPAERSWLPNAAGYPLHLHERIPAPSRLARLDGAQVVIYEDLFERRPDWRALVPASDALAAFLGEGSERLFRVNDRVYREEGSCNTYLVRTKTGSVVVDPAGAAREGSFLRALAARWPVEAILLTHGHDDHRLGIRAFRGGADVPVVAQREIVKQVAIRGRLAPFFAPRDAAQSGKPPAPPTDPAPVEATVLFADEHELKAGGLTFRMFRVGGETPDTSLIWVPELKALFTGDDFYDSFPMLAPPRGSGPRPALEYVGALDAALALGPAVLLPGHGEPVTGAAEVRRRLTEYRDAVRHVHDAVVAGMNAGKDPYTLMREVRLPEGSRVGEFYGNVRWAVRGIWNEYAGSFDGEPAELLGRPPRAVLPELASLAGVEAVATRAREALASGEALRTLQLADAALSADPEHTVAGSVRVAALGLLRDGSRNFAERNWLTNAVRLARPAETSNAAPASTPATGPVVPDATRRDQDLDAAIAAKDWVRALPLAEQEAENAEEAHVEALYRLARVQAFLGQRKEALDALERAYAAGIVDVFALRKDEAFASFKDDERFKALSKAIGVKRYIAMLERKERDSFQKPDEVMRALALRPGERVADIGAGSGYFTLRVARAVGPSGQVLAIDINPDILEFLDRRVKEAGLANVKTIHVEKDDPKLPAGGVDTILMVDTLHYVAGRDAYAKKLRAGLAPGGRVVVIDYTPKPWEERPWGPPPSQKMAREEVDQAMAAAGLVPSKVHEFLTEQFFVEYVAR